MPRLSQEQIAKIRRLATLLAVSGPAYVWCDGHNSIVRHSVLDQYITACSPDVIRSLLDDLDEARRQLEQEQVRLAGCGVAATGNTEAAVAARVRPGDYGYSASYGDVCRAVDREMEARRQRDESDAALDRLLSWIQIFQINEVPPPLDGDLIPPMHAARARQRESTPTPETK